MLIAFCEPTLLSWKDSDYSRFLRQSPTMQSHFHHCNSSRPMPAKDRRRLSQLPHSTSILAPRWKVYSTKPMMVCSSRAILSTWGLIPLRMNRDQTPCTQCPPPNRSQISCPSSCLHSTKLPSILPNSSHTSTRTRSLQLIQRTASGGEPSTPAPQANGTMGRAASTAARQQALSRSSAKDRRHRAQSANQTERARLALVARPTTVLQQIKDGRVQAWVRIHPAKLRFGARRVPM